MPQGSQARSVLITGCASGIGRHLTARLAEAGYRVWASDVDLPRLQEASAADRWVAERVCCLPLDVRRADDWSRALEKVVSEAGRLDVLLNVAGVVLPRLVHQADSQAIDLHLDINAKGTMLGTAMASAQMCRQGFGHIVNIASMAGIAPVPGIALYSASKFAVRGFSLAVAQELAPMGVAVTVVCPDAVNTPMVDLQLDYTEAAMTFSGSRILSVQEVGDAIVERVLPRRPLELMLPRHRGWLAKASSAFPSLTLAIGPRLTRLGLIRQRAAKARLRGPERDPSE